MAVRTRTRAIPAPVYVIAGIASTQVGGAIAKTLFDDLGPTGTVLLRTAFAALVLWLLWRPRVAGHPPRDLALAAAFGLALAAMNLSFYEALDRIPLGIAVTIEFAGPLAVAVGYSRRALDLVWVVLAAAGVALLANGGGKAVHPAGIVLAAVAGFFWALYILLSVRVGRRWPGASGLAPAMALGGLIALPWGVLSAHRHLGDPQLVGAAVGVGLLSSALPWSMELEALRRLPSHVFSVVLSLEPAVAALAGFVFLHEHLRLRAWLAIALVVLASAGAASRRGPVLPVDA